jgi:O-antigen ligase
MRRVAFATLLVFAALIPLEDSLQLGVGRVSRLVGLVCFGLWVLATIATGRVRVPPVAAWTVAAFLGWAYLSYFWSADPSATLTKATTFLQLGGLVWIAYDLLDTRERLSQLAVAIVIGAGLAGLLTIITAVQGEAARGVSRFTVFDAGPNNAAAVLVLSIGVAMFLLRLHPARSRLAIVTTFVVISVVAVLLTASRGALVALCSTVAVLIVDRRNLMKKRLVWGIAMVVVVAAFAVTVVPRASFERLGTTGTEITEGTLNARTTYWRLALDLFEQRPIQGVGAGAFPEENLRLGASGKVAHNTFISILVELGLVGLVLFLLAFGRAAARLARADRRVWRPFLAIMVGGVVSAAALSMELRKLVWLLLALALAESSLASAREPSTDPETVRAVPAA